jgi:chaperonin GroEL
MNNTLSKQETLQKLLKGVDTLANVVKTTSGSKGHTILIQREDGSPYITKDGVTVAKAIKCEDIIENLGCKLVQQAAELTVDQAGDGTTATVTMAQRLMQNIINCEISNHRQLFEDIENITQDVLFNLQKTVRKVKTKKDAIRIATISTNNKELGELVGTVMWDARKNGVVLFELSDNGDTYVYQESGSRYERMYDLKQFLGLTGTRVQYDNPIITIFSEDVVDIETIQEVVEQSKLENRAAVFFAPDYSKMVLQILEFNSIKNGYKILPLYIPGHGDEKKEYIKDIIALVHDGNVDRIVATKQDFTLFTKYVTPSLQNRMDVIAYQIGQEKTKYYKEKLEKRLSILSQKVYTIYAGATSEIEQSELKDRMEDGLLATRAAIEDGYVIGGGMALYNIAKTLSSQGLANQIMYDVLISPCEQILTNATATWAFDSVGDEYGFNTTTMKVEDFYKSGIIDPYKVVASSLNNAVSVAKTIISLNGSITWTK